MEGCKTENRAIQPKDGLICLKDLQIDSLETLGKQPDLRILDISGTSIKSLEQLEPQPNLIKVIANDSKLEFLTGISKQKNLREISYLETPLSTKKYMRVSLLIAIGQGLSVVNDVTIKAFERIEASKYPPIAKELINKGWELTGKVPTDEEFYELSQQFGVDYFSFYQTEEDAKIPDLKLARAISRKLGSIGIRIQEGPNMKNDIINAITSITKAISFLYSESEDNHIAKPERHNKETRDPVSEDDTVLSLPFELKQTTEEYEFADSSDIGIE
ncbi:hypothetical protein GPJ56_010655 [Histomonas meleagridis]|uniref:uncharacterized protein n=1 Tax=Histomonas meleagridis TaxID=135588 RepID=UPI003559B33D|nr:hypothetical protein GPJ56_010655 [Histomonas meleagridis]KAH0806927.1 hypothetical protein GO595_000103 [Histomonas meleagridis]